MVGALVEAGEDGLCNPTSTEAVFLDDFSPASLFHLLLEKHKEVGIVFYLAEPLVEFAIVRHLLDDQVVKVWQRTLIRLVVIESPLQLEGLPPRANTVSKECAIWL